MDLLANCWISVATTAKPFPLSPALAASMLALRLNRFVCEAMDAMISVASLICTTDSFVFAVCASISCISSCTSLLLSSSSRMVSTFCFSAQDMASAFCCICSISSVVRSIFSPILCTFFAALSEISACVVALCIMLSIAPSTCRIEVVASLAVSPSSPDAISTASAFPAIFAILLIISSCRLLIAFDKSPSSSCLFINFVSISFFRLPEDTDCTILIPFFNALEKLKANTAATAIQSNITISTTKITVLMILLIAESFCALFAPTKIMPTGFLLSP